MEVIVIEKDLANVPTLKEQAMAIKVTDNVTRIQAAELGKMAKELVDKITLYHDDVVKKAHEAHKSALARKNADLKPAQEVIDMCRDNINTYDREQQRLERIEQDRLQKIADDNAEKERQKLLAQAIKAEEKGQTEKAEAKLEQAEMVYVAPVTVTPTVAKTVGTSAGNITQAKEVNVFVTDLKAFVTELMKSNAGALASIFDVKVSGLKNFVKTNGLDVYPGLNIVKTTGVRF